MDRDRIVVASRSAADTGVVARGVVPVPLSVVAGTDIPGPATPAPESPREAHDGK
jgi:hypothetical protein